MIKMGLVPEVNKKIKKNKKIDYDNNKCYHLFLKMFTYFDN